MNKIGVLNINGLINPEIGIFEAREIGCFIEILDDKIIFNNLPIQNFDAISFLGDANKQKAWRPTYKASYLHLDVEDAKLYSGDIMVLETQSVNIVSGNLTCVISFELKIKKSIDFGIKERLA